ncbi:MAG: hypothetical protein WHT84_06925 [Breznakiellaceae bacterium]
MRNIFQRKHILLMVGWLCVIVGTVRAQQNWDFSLEELFLLSDILSASSEEEGEDVSELYPGDEWGIPEDDISLVLEREVPYQYGLWRIYYTDDGDLVIYTTDNPISPRIALWMCPVSFYWTFCLKYKETYYDIYFEGYISEGIPFSICPWELKQKTSQGIAENTVFSINNICDGYQYRYQMQNNSIFISILPYDTGEESYDIILTSDGTVIVKNPKDTLYRFPQDLGGGHATR